MNIMKLLFLHISDLHIDKTTKFSYLKIDGISNVLRKYSEIDNIFIICTGDLANRGTEEDYLMVRNFFSKLINSIKRVTKHQYIQLYVVPGNHDILIDKDYKISKDDINDFSFDKELNKMENYFSFLQNWKAASNKKKNKFDIVSDKININDFVISINQINTAPFSGLNHEDKEFHYVKTSSLERIDASCDLNITMMHHSYNWFHENVKTELENKIKKTDILFYGHEHDMRTTFLHGSDSNILVLKAGSFDSDSYYNNSYFNIVVYSTEQKTGTVESYSWNKSENIFISENKEEFKKNKNTQCIYKESFIKGLLTDDKTNIGLNLFDYFVFPETRIDNENKNIYDYKGIKKVIRNYRIISISGKSESGRTVLLKYMYNDLRNEKMALFINSKDMDNLNIKTIISHAINDQIEGQFSYEKFQQFPKENKTIFIDDFDKLNGSKTKEKLMEFLEKNFYQIVIAVSTDSVSSLKEKFKESFENNIIDISVKPFTSKQRNEIIEKISKRKGLLIDKNYFEDIDKCFKSIPALKFLGNTFSINYISLVLSSGSVIPSGSKSNFDILFEQTLRKSIFDYSKQENVDTYFKILELLCHKIHFEKKNQISLSELSILITNYNNEYDKNVRTQNFIASMLKSRIFIETIPESYMLANKMYLAYFVAKGIWYKIINEGSYEEFDYVLKNVCFGINGDVLMFIIYITQNFKLLNSIFEECENITRDWCQLSFDNKTISFLYTKDKKIESLSNVDEEQIKNYKQRQVEKEIYDFETYPITCEGIYDYDEDDIYMELNEINRINKYVELISRGIRSFNASIKANQKQILIDGVIRNLNKFLYKILSEFEDGLDEFIEFLCENRPKINKTKVKSELIDFLLVFVLSVYDYNLSLCTCNETYKSLDNYFIQTSNESIDNLFYKLVYLDNSRKYDEFVSCLKELLKSTSDPCVLHMVRILVFRKTYTENLSKSQRDSLIDTFNNLANSSNKISHQSVTLALMQKQN